MTGIYLKEGEIEYLFPTQVAVLTAKNTFNTDAAIPLITDDATRDFRKALLYCRNMPVGCAVTIIGHITTCERADLLGASSLPCLEAEDGRAIERR